MVSKVLSTYRLLLVLAVLLAGCSRSALPVNPNPAPVEGTSQSTLTPAPWTAEASPLPAATATTTPTPEPSALVINGVSISMVEYQAELTQLQEAYQTLEKDLPADQQRQKVVDSLTATALLAQAAYENGYQLAEADLQAEIDRLAQQAGGVDAFQQWQTKYGYTQASFRASLQRSMAAAWQRDQLADAVPAAVEQVHARQIVVLDEASAQKALQQVSVPGTDFENYAFRYDLQTGGDLGWFPRGYLLQHEVEEAAFNLQPGQVSAVIQSPVGYHILQVVAREQRPLSIDARRVLQHQALEDWLRARREQSQIELLVP